MSPLIPAVRPASTQDPSENVAAHVETVSIGGPSVVAALTEERAVIQIVVVPSEQALLEHARTVMAEDERDLGPISPEILAEVARLWTV